MVLILIFLGLLVCPQVGLGQMDGVNISDRLNYRKTSVIVGDLDTVATFDVRLSGYSCRAWWESRSNPIQADDGFYLRPASNTESGYVIFAPFSAGVKYDTLLLNAHGESISGQCFGFSGTYKLCVSRTAIADTMFLVRPRHQEVSLAPDSVEGGWVGYATLRLKNKNRDSATVERLTIKDTSGKFTFEPVSFGSLPLVVRPWSDTTKLTYRIRASRGPIDDATFSMVVFAYETDWANKTRRDTIVLTIVQQPARRDFEVWAEPDTLEIVQIEGLPESRLIQIHANDTITVTHLGQPASPFNVKADPDGTTYQVSSKSTAEGVYNDELTVYFVYTDHNGEPHNDSTVIPLRLESTRDYQPNVWRLLESPADSVVQIVLGGADTMFALEQGKGIRQSIWRSTDDGATWHVAYENQTKDPVEQLGWGEDRLFCKRGSFVYYSRDGGMTWTSSMDSVGIWIYYGGYQFQRSFEGSIDQRGDELYLYAYNANYYNRGDPSFPYTVLYVWERSRWNQITANPKTRSVFGSLPQAGAVRILPDSAKIAATPNRGIYTSPLSPTNWKRASYFIPEFADFVVAGDTVLAYAKQAVHWSTDRARTWEYFSEGLGTSPLRSASHRPGRRALVLDSASRIYQTVQAFGRPQTTSDVGPREPLDQDTSPLVEPCNLRVYDVLGRPVLELPEFSLDIARLRLQSLHEHGHFFYLVRCKEGARSGRITF